MSAQRWVPIAAISTAFGVMLWWTWGTWPDVLVDFGRELYVPWRISVGDVLYRDIASLSGPLSPYVNAGWFGLFGVSLRSLVIGNLALLAMTVWLLFKIVSGVASRLSATLAALTCVVMFGFSVGNYNYVAPYSHELTHGLALSLGAIACFSAFLRSGNLVTIGGAGLALGLAFLTKAEVFTAVATALLAGVTCTLWIGAIPAGRRRRAVLALMAGSAAPVLIAFAFFSSVLRGTEAWLAVMGAWRYVFTPGLPSSIYYQRIAGLIDPVQSVGTVISAAVLYIVVFGIAALGCLLASKYGRDRVLSLGLAFALGVLVFGLITRILPWAQAARPLPVLMFGLFVIIVVGIARHTSDPPEDRTRSVVQLTVVVFALVLLARMALNASFYHYGFVLAMPATVVLVVMLISWIPARLTTAGADGRTFLAFALAGWLVLMVAHLNGMAGDLSHKRHVISAGPDAFLTDSRAAEVNVFLSEIRHRLGPDQTFVALPEGVMLNYLSRRANPTRYVTFMPPELAAFGEANMLAALSAHPPDYIALVHKDTTEYGPHFFGRDYGQRLLAWIEVRYRTVRTFGAQPLRTDEFGISLLERIDQR